MAERSWQCSEAFAELMAVLRAAEQNFIRAKGRGLGKKMMRACLNEAKQLGISRIFILTMRDGFFKKFGFKRVVKNNLPHKVWTECVRCPYFPETSVEIAMVKDLTPGKEPPLPAFSEAEIPQYGFEPMVPKEPEEDLNPKSLSGRRRREPRT